MKDVRTVKELVKYPDGKAVDIFESAESGTLFGISGVAANRNTGHKNNKTVKKLRHNIAILISVV